MRKTFRNILFVAAASGEGQFRQIVDPALAEKLAESGFRCHSCYLPQLREEHLRESSVLAIVRTPMPGHARDDSALFRDWTPRILDAVRENGLGLVLFFSESYGRSEGTLNEFTSPLGLRCYFNRITESDPSRRGMIPNLDGGETVSADLSGTDGPNRLEVVTGGGHGTQQLTCDPDENWEILLRGAKTCRSEAFPSGFYSHGSSAPLTRPVFAAARRYGKGEIAAFPGSAPLWIASGFLPRFEGYLLNQHEGAGLRFLSGLLNRTARRECGGGSAALEALDREREADRTFSFRYATAEEQENLRRRKPFRIFLGSVPAGMDVPRLAAEARECGCVAAVAVEPYENLTPESWRERRDSDRALPGIDVLPGYEQIDDEGNASVVFSVEELPDQRKSYPNSNLLEDLLVKLSGYAAIYARTGQNRYPLWRYGGYNLVEYTGPESLEMFREKVSTVSSLGPVAVSRGESPGTERFQTWVLAPDAKSWRRNLTENFHHTFVTSGSLRLNGFGLFGPTLMCDDWEGFWYEWDTGETATLELSLEAGSPITEVTVWDGMREFRRFTPGADRFEHSEPIEFERDLRLTVTARCADGGELVSSYPLYTRNRHFWAHAGSDQMNDYHNVFEENPRGIMGIGNRFYEPYGFVTCGFAWGDYVRITSPAPWSDLMPSGIEVSSMTANFKSFHPSPFVIAEDGTPDFLNNHRRRLELCDAGVHLVRSESSGMWLERPGAVWTGHGGREFHPTRAIVPSRLWSCSGVYEIPRWKPYRPTEVLFHLKLRFLRDFELSAGRIILAQSIHVRKPGLLLNGVPLEELMLPGTDVSADWKEWDNLNAFELFRSHPETGPALEIADRLVVSGDSCGTFEVQTPSGLPGRWFVRAWGWRADGYLLSFEWEPATKQFAKETEFPLEYRISLNMEEPR